MTREEVIRLAKNYCDYSSDSKGRESFEFDDYGLYFFAELVAAEYKQDALRYRWLRDRKGCPFSEASDELDDLDSAVDAAMEKVK